ncbi:MAG: hypothetical protein U0R51_01775 [Solirubrobacterales bacterium]
MAIAALALASGVADATAGTKVLVGTKVSIINVASDPQQAYVLGTLGSSKPQCVGGREIRVTLVPVKGKPVPFDVARASDPGGGWLAVAATAPLIDKGPFEKAVAKAPAKTIKVGKKQIVCKAAKASFITAE